MRDLTCPGIQKFRNPAKSASEKTAIFMNEPKRSGAHLSTCACGCRVCFTREWVPSPRAPTSLAACVCVCVCVAPYDTTAIESAERFSANPIVTRLSAAPVEPRALIDAAGGVVAAQGPPGGC